MKFSNNKGSLLIFLLIALSVVLISISFFKIVLEKNVLSISSFLTQSNLNTPDDSEVNVDVTLKTSCSGNNCDPNSNQQTLILSIKKTKNFSDVIDIMKKSGFDIYDKCNAPSCNPERRAFVFTETESAFETNITITPRSFLIRFLFRNPKLKFNVNIPGQNTWIGNNLNELSRDIPNPSFIEIDYTFIPKTNSKYEGVIRVDIKTSSKRATNLVSRIITNGIVFEEYCNFSRCPLILNFKPKEIKRDLSKGIYHQFDIPVNSRTKSIDINLCKIEQSKDCIQSELIINKVPTNWVRVNQTSSVISRVSEQAVIDVALIRVDKGKELYSITIRGTGEAANSIVKTLRIRGINELFGESYENSKTNVSKPPVKVLDGYYAFELVANIDTLGFYINSIDKNINAKVGKVPAGWRVSKESNGLERDIPLVNPTIIVSETNISTKDSTLNFVAIGYGDSFFEIIRNVRRGELLECSSENSCKDKSPVTVKCVTLNNLARQCIFSKLVQKSSNLIKLESSFKDISINFTTSGWGSEKNGNFIIKRN